MPFTPDSREILTVTNMSIGRIVDINWTGVGGKNTLCRYQVALTDTSFVMTNLLAIGGRTHDGAIVLDVVLGRKRLARLEAGVQELIG